MSLYIAYRHYALQTFCCKLCFRIICLQTLFLPHYLSKRYFFKKIGALVRYIFKYDLCSTLKQHIYCFAYADQKVLRVKGISCGIFIVTYGRCVGRRHFYCVCVDFTTFALVPCRKNLSKNVRAALTACIQCVMWFARKCKCTGNESDDEI